MGSALDWFFAFMTRILDGIAIIFVGLFNGIVQIFNVPYYIDQFSKCKGNFNFIDWIFAILLLLLVIAVFAIIIYFIYLLIRKIIRYHSSFAGKDDILEELAELHRDVVRLTKEKENIMALKLGQTNISADEISEIFRKSREQAVIDTNKEISALNGDGLSSESINTAEKAVPPPAQPSGNAASAAQPANAPRFSRLLAVDNKYRYYVAPEYRRDLNLQGICENFRNFACYSMGLFYEIKTIRLMFAGLASTKLILLQGISGTGKTSLPYAMGKYFSNPASIASVQPSWRDRTELFGYFNEFTKRYNETEFLRRVYEAAYNDDINIVILDEMNIARVEYYFAEMLSILEMPDQSERKIELVPSPWKNDPVKLVDGLLNIPANVWYIGTANNDDSTFSVSDKVYDRALVINLDSKGIEFKAPPTEATQISYSYVEGLYKQAIKDNVISKYILDELSSLDLYIIEHFRVAFGNRIMKQLHTFLPVYVATGGTEAEGLDYILATKIFRKFESLNLALIRDEIDGLIDRLDEVFGSGTMSECISYLNRLKKMY